jgi:hypothetical protein
MHSKQQLSSEEDSSDQDARQCKWELTIELSVALMWLLHTAGMRSVRSDRDLLTVTTTAAAVLCCDSTNDSSDSEDRYASAIRSTAACQLARCRGGLPPLLPTATYQQRQR